MKNSKCGSTVLILIIISAIILMYYINAQRSGEFLIESNFKKYNFDKHYRITESLCNFAIVTCYNNFDEFISRAKKQDNQLNLILYNGIWPNIKTENDFLGTVKITVIDPQIFIETLTINQKNKEILQIKTTLLKEDLGPSDEKKRINKISIVDWQIN